MMNPDCHFAAHPAVAAYVERLERIEAAARALHAAVGDHLVASIRYTSGKVTDEQLDATTRCVLEAAGALGAALTPEDL